MLPKTFLELLLKFITPLKLSGDIFFFKGEFKKYSKKHFKITCDYKY